MKLFTSCALLMMRSICQAQKSPDVIDSLARSFSGSDRAPICNADVSDADVKPGATCNWVPDAEVKLKGTVTTTRYPIDSALLTWERPTRTAVEAQQVIDSLGTALKARSMKMRGCGHASADHPDGARAWESRNLVVYVSDFWPNDGNPKLIVMATTNPSAFPDVICGR